MIPDIHDRATHLQDHFIRGAPVPPVIFCTPPAEYYLDRAVQLHTEATWRPCLPYNNSYQPRRVFSLLASLLQINRPRTVGRLDFFVIYFYKHEICAWYLAVP